MISHWAADEGWTELVTPSPASAEPWTQRVRKTALASLLVFVVTRQPGREAQLKYLFQSSRLLLTPLFSHPC